MSKNGLPVSRGEQLHLSLFHRNMQAFRPACKRQRKNQVKLLEPVQNPLQGAFSLVKSPLLPPKGQQFTRLPPQRRAEANRREASALRPEQKYASQDKDSASCGMRPKALPYLALSARLWRVALETLRCGSQWKPQFFEKNCVKLQMLNRFWDMKQVDSCLLQEIFA